MDYAEKAKLEIFGLAQNIKTEAEYAEFKDMIAHYFAQKAQKEIDQLCNEGKITPQTIDEWGKEHMRTPYKNALHRSGH